MKAWFLRQSLFLSVVFAAFAQNATVLTPEIVVTVLKYILLPLNAGEFSLMDRQVINELVKIEWNDVAVFENKVEFKIMRSKRTGPMQYDTKLIDDNLAVGILKYYMSLFAETVSYYIKYIYKLNSMFNRIRRVVFCALLIMEKKVLAN